MGRRRLDKNTATAAKAATMTLTCSGVMLRNVLLSRLLRDRGSPFSRAPLYPPRLYTHPFLFLLHTIVRFFSCMTRCPPVLAPIPFSCAHSCALLFRASHTAFSLIQARAPTDTPSLSRPNTTTPSIHMIADPVGERALLCRPLARDVTVDSDTFDIAVLWFSELPPRCSGHLRLKFAFAHTLPVPLSVFSASCLPRTFESPIE